MNFGLRKVMPTSWMVSVPCGRKGISTTLLLTICLLKGEMQNYYFHGVSTSAKQLKDDPNQKRIAIIFRDGEMKSYKKDSGQQLMDLEPRKRRKPIRGNGIDGLVEGEVYKLNDLRSMNAHL